MLSQIPEFNSLGADGHSRKMPRFPAALVLTGTQVTGLSSLIWKSSPRPEPSDSVLLPVLDGSLQHGSESERRPFSSLRLLHHEINS